MRYPLKVSRLRKSYENERATGRKAEAVKGVSLAVKQGELLVLTGESGCGKTTLLKLIAGLEEPDAGTVHFDGKLVTGPSQNLVPGHPDIKLAFQDYRLFPNLTLFQNLEQALKGYQKVYQTQRIDLLLQLCALEPLRHKYPRELSGGEQQRVALARAMADEPAVLLLDEPFSNLDELTKSPLKRAILNSLRTFGTTAILVTHDHRDALTMADRIAVMKEGRFRQVDTPQVVYQQPLDTYVARFFGHAHILPAAWVAKWLHRSLDEKPVGATQVCIRTEAIRISSPENCQLQGKVLAIRFAGAYEEVDVSTEEEVQLTLHTAVGQAKLGEVLPLWVDPAQIHYF